MDLVHLFNSEQIVPFEINAIGPVTASSAARYTTNDPASGQNSPAQSKRVLSSRQQKPKTLLKQRQRHVTNSINNQTHQRLQTSPTQAVGVSSARGATQVPATLTTVVEFKAKKVHGRTGTSNVSQKRIVVKELQETYALQLQQQQQLSCRSYNENKSRASIQVIELPTSDGGTEKPYLRRTQPPRVSQSKPVKHLEPNKPAPSQDKKIIEPQEPHESEVNFECGNHSYEKLETRVQSRLTGAGFQLHSNPQLIEQPSNLDLALKKKRVLSAHNNFFRRTKQNKFLAGPSSKSRREVGLDLPSSQTTFANENQIMVNNGLRPRSGINALQRNTTRNMLSQDSASFVGNNFSRAKMSAQQPTKKRHFEVVTQDPYMVSPVKHKSSLMFGGVEDTIKQNSNVGSLVPVEVHMTDEDFGTNLISPTAAQSPRTALVQMQTFTNQIVSDNILQAFTSNQIEQTGRQLNQLSEIIETTSKRLQSASVGRPSSKPQHVQPKQQRIIFANFNELDCFKDSETNLINFKELEMCRYFEHVKRKDQKQERAEQKLMRKEQKLQHIIQSSQLLQSVLEARMEIMKVSNGATDDCVLSVASTVADSKKPLHRVFSHEVNIESGTKLESGLKLRRSTDQGIQQLIVPKQLIFGANQ